MSSSKLRESKDSQPLSADFYAALIAGQLARYDEFDESRADFSRWKGIFETWLRRKAADSKQLQESDVAETPRVQLASPGISGRG